MLFDSGFRRGEEEKRDIESICAGSVVGREGGMGEEEGYTEVLEGEGEGGAAFVVCRLVCCCVCVCVCVCIYVCICVCTCVCACVCVSISYSMFVSVSFSVSVSVGMRVRIPSMGWLRLVGSLKLQVSFAKEPYKRDGILQKRPVILRSLLIVATPYDTMLVCIYVNVYVCI